MSDKDRNVHAISTGIEGHDLVNVKFFMGTRRDVTQDELCREAAQAHTQVIVGKAKAKPSIDGDMVTVSIDKFVQ